MTNLENEKSISEEKSQPTLEGIVWKRWYIRYLVAAFMLGMSYITFQINSEGIELKILALLLFNSITFWVYIACGVFYAWELSLLIVAIAFLFFLFKGISMLPVSVAVILGSLIIAYSVWKFKRRM